jgi:hypothetical protein
MYTILQSLNLNTLSTLHKKDKVLDLDMWIVHIQILLDFIFFV